MFYVLGVIIAIVGLLWLLNGALVAGAVTILLGLFVAGYLPTRR